MRAVWTIAWWDLRIFLGERSNLLQLTLVPVILTLVLGFALGGAGEREAAAIRLDVLDEDDSPRSQELVDTLPAQESSLRVCPAASETCDWDGSELPDLETAIGRVRGGAADALLQIPAGYGAQLEAQQSVALPFHTTALVPSSDPAWQAVQAALAAVNADLATDVTARALHAALGLADDGLEAYVQTVRQIADRARASRKAAASTALVASSVTGEDPAATDIPAGFTQSVPGMASFYVLFSVMGGGMAVLLRERREGTLARMATLPLRRMQVIAGKILARFLTGILQFLIIFAVGVIVGIDFGRDTPALLLLMAGYTLVITALGIALAGLIRNDEQASLLTALIAMVMAALGGAWWPLSLAPPFMQTIGYLTPVAWAMDGFHQLISRGGGLAEVAPSLLALAVFGIVFFALGLRLFRFRQ